MIFKLCLKAVLISALFFLFSACSDEEDPDTSLQGDINDEIAKLNDAGSFLSFNLKLMDAESPVEGATVVLSAGQGDSLITYSEVTDENGVAYFETVKIGGNIITASKDGYFTLLGVVDFRFEEGYNYSLTDNQVVVIPRSESAIVPFYATSADGSATATIKGTATIETDLTNTQSEVPEGTTIKANFSKEVISMSSGVTISEYTISSNSKIGSGVVGADGNYEIHVPVSLGGSNIALIIPEIQVNQKIAINGVQNEEQLEKPEVREILTSFGPGSYADEIPYVSGVRAVFSEPVAAGSGFTLSNFQRAGRPLLTSYYGYYELYPNANDQVQHGEGVTYRFTAGMQYQSTPEIEVSDPTGSDFEGRINMKFAVRDLEVTNSGNYEPGEYIYGYIRYKTNDYIEHFTSFYVYADENGKITQEAIDEMVSNNSYSYRWGENYRNMYNEVDSFFVEFESSYSTGGNPAEATVLMNGRINYMQINNHGAGYTDPTVTLKGGNPTEAATFEIIDFATPWSFELDNSAITPYVLVPNIDFEYLEYGTGDYEVNNGSVYDYSTGDSYMLEDILTTNENGEIVYGYAEHQLVTEFYSLEAPTVFVTDQKHVPAQAFITLNNKGELSALYMNQHGRGYTGRPTLTIEPTIEGLPGTGAEVILRGGDYHRGEYLWDGNYYIVNSGTGYVPNVNQIIGQVSSDGKNFNISGSIHFGLTPGDVVYRNIEYGTGNRLTDVF